MSVTVRFAPSPTGLLNVGNARMALVNWLFAKAHGGYFVLRHDDADSERAKPEYVDAIADDLRWLGLAWDRKAFQSKRLAAYEEAADRLRAAGRLYPCYETPEELDAKRRLLLSQGRPPVYDRAHLHLPAVERRRFEDEGRRPHWRFKLDHHIDRWDDLVRGDSHIDCASLSDPVLVRADGTFLYPLPSVVDDIALGISHVIRGEEHVANTAPQLQLFKVLKAEPPSFGHLPPMTDSAGGGLSKRHGGASLRELRADGVEPMALTSLLAKLGTSDAVELRGSLDQLVDDFDIRHFSRTTPRFDPAELGHLNSRLLHSLSWEEARPRLEAVGLREAPAEFWEAVRPNLDRVADARDWWAVVTGPVQPVIEDAEVARAALERLPPAPWDATTWGTLTTAVGQVTGRTGKALYHPLRLALTGRGHGPELKNLLPLIGRDRAAGRLAGETA